MIYYIVSNSADEKVVGCYPQTSGLFEGYDHALPNAMENLTSDEFPDFVPDLRFELDDEAKLTDVVSASNLDFATGLLMNHKAKGIFEKCKIMAHEYFPAIVRTNSGEIPFYWLHMVSPIPSPYIDIPKSVFSEILPNQTKVSRNFSDGNELSQYFDTSINQLIIKELTLTNDFESNNYDMFCLPGIFSWFLTSEKLCESIQKEKVTGLIIKEQGFYRKRP